MVMRRPLHERHEHKVFYIDVVVWVYAVPDECVCCRVLELMPQNRQFTSHPSSSLESRMPWRFQNVNLRYLLENFNMCHTDDILFVECFYCLTYHSSLKIIYARVFHIFLLVHMIIPVLYI